MATPTFDRSDLRRSSDGFLRLQTLVRLRWLAVLGQTIAVLFVYYGLGFNLPLGLCLGLIALSAWVNIYISIRWRKAVRLSAEPAALFLIYDTAQLAGLIYLTGGLQNPFAFLFLVPVTVAAASLPLIWTLLVCFLSLVAVTLVTFLHMPLPWADTGRPELPLTYIAGMWVALVSGTVFSTIYARRIAEESRQMSMALAATELVLAREQRLSALDGLAAAAAHELGTPLATIALVAKELRREFTASSPHSEDLDLLVSQAARCREIMSRLADRDGALPDAIMSREKLTVMIENLVAPLRGSDAEVLVDMRGEDDSVEPVILRNPAISYGLGNILENAIDFATSKVTVSGTWSENSVTVEVRDDGPGIDQSILDRLGDPFVTTRPGYSTSEASEGSDSMAHEGMGLGVFIAQTLLQRSGAKVILTNQKQPDRGAVATIVWPRTAFDI
jgi:two-component system, sensor histidine kinase RegB